MSADKKVALITGSTAGIGLSCAQALAKRGVNVIVSGSRKASAVSETLEDLKRLCMIFAYWMNTLRLYNSLFKGDTCT